MTMHAVAQSRALGKRVKILAPDQTPYEVQGQEVHPMLVNFDHLVRSETHLIQLLVRRGDAEAGQGTAL